MTIRNHVTAPTLYVEAAGIRLAYRRFGADKGVPLLFIPHYRAGMDHWDGDALLGRFIDRHISWQFCALQRNPGCNAIK